MTDVAVSIGVSQRPWATDLKSFIADHGGIRLAGTVLSQRDALEQSSSVLIADDIASFLTHRLVDRLHRSGRVVVGVFDPVEGVVGEKRLGEMSVDVAVSAHEQPERLVQVMLEVAADASSIAAVEETPAPGRGGRITVVTGFGGATEAAVHLAACWARKRMTTVLVDYDTLSPAIAQRLDLRPSPNILGAIDSLMHSRGEIEASLQRHSSGVRVLAGLPRGRDWELAPPDQLADLLGVLSLASTNVVVNTAHHSEAGTGLRGRFEAARVGVGEADSVVACMLPTPVGVRRLVGWVAEARSMIRAPLHIVANRSPRSLFQRGELLTEMLEAFRPASVTWLPGDTRLARHAWDGTLRRGGAYVRGIEKIARLVEADPLRVRAVA